MNDNVVEGPFKTAPAPDCCGNCHFWFNPDNSPVGLCRRHPPLPIMVGTQQMANGQMNGITQSCHPPMQAMGWCGEHRRRPTPGATQESGYEHLQRMLQHTKTISEVPQPSVAEEAQPFHRPPEDEGR